MQQSQVSGDVAASVSAARRPIRRPEHPRLGGEDVLDEEPVHVGVPLPAGVGEHDELEVAVGRVTQRGEHHSARGDAAQHEVRTLWARSTSSRSVP